MAKSKSLETKSKKRKAEEVEPVADDHPAVDPAESPKKKKKKKSADDPAPAQDPVPLETQADSPQKKKKKKKKGTAEPIPEEESVQEPVQPKKKHRNHTEFVDPRYDESLAAQSRKGLEYAFLQFNKPSKWKFNKAKQNWLLRNVWSSEEIPESHFPLAVQYLSKIQGGSRQQLKETCTKYAEPPATPATPADPPPTTLPKAGILINKSESAGAIIAPPTTVAKETTEEIRRSRAQELLKVLSD